MAAAASLWVKLGLSDSDFVKSLKQAETKLNQFGNRLSSIGTRMTTAFTLPLALASGACIKLGMGAVEAENLFEKSMGGMTSAARQWSQDLRKNLGLNEYELRRNIGLFQTMGTAMEVPEKAAFEMSKGITELGHDMASFFNVTSEQSLTDLKAIFTGEAEPLKKYGVILNETTTKQWALTNGLIKQGEEMTQAQKVVARYNLVLEQTKNAENDLAETLDSPANKLRILQEQLKMASTEMGIALLPTVTGLLQTLTPLVKKISDLATWFSQLPAPVRNTAGALLTISIAIGPLMLGIGKMVSGWSALIGILRMLPTLKIGSAIGDIATYIGGAITGTWSWAEAMGALTASFGPMLVGGAIIVGLGVIIAMFAEASRQAKVMAMDMKNATDMAQIQESIRLNQEKLKALQDQRVADKKTLSEPQTTSNLEAQKMATLRTTGAEAERRRMLELEYGTQIQAGQERLKQLSGEFSNASVDFETNWQNLMESIKGQSTPSDSKNTVADAQNVLAAKLREIAAKEALNLPDYDATKERLQAMQQALDSAVVATDASSSDGQVAIKAMVELIRTYNSQLAAQMQQSLADEDYQKGLANFKKWREKWDQEVADWVAEDLASIDGEDTEDEDKPTLGDYLKGIGSGLLQKTPLLNNVMQGATQGAAFGPLGMLAGAIMPLITESETFKNILEIINPILQTMANSVGAILQPLLPLIQVISATLTPVISFLASIFKDILTPILQALFPVFKLLGEVVITVALVMASAWNALASTINALLGWLGVEIGLLKTSSLLDALKALSDMTWESAMAQSVQTKATSEATAAMRNIPTGFKYRINQIAATDPRIISATTSGTGVRNEKYVTVKVDLTGANIYGINDLDRYLQTSIDTALGKNLSTQGVG